MSFLDKINAAPVTEGTSAPKKVNPLLKKKLGDKKETAETPKKTIPLKKKEEAPKAEEVSAEEVMEAPVKEAKPEPKKPEPKKEESKKPESKKEEAQKPAEKSDPKPAKEAPKEEAKAEPKEEPKKAETKKPAAKKTASKAKKASTAKASASAKSDEPEVFTQIPTTAASFNEAVTSISSSFVDEDWEEFKAEVQEELSNIIISDDMNPGTLKVVISELSILREKVWFSYQEQKTLYENLSSKEPEGLIERIKRVNLGSGNNDMERRRAGVMACMQHDTGSGEVNLFEVLDETRLRYNFLRSIIDSIKYKTDVLITLNGALKLEKEHL